MGKCRSFMVFVSDRLRKMWYVIEVLNPRKSPQKKKKARIGDPYSQPGQLATNCSRADKYMYAILDGGMGD